MTARRDILAETYDAVLFDMDGTLLDSVDSVVRSWTRWAAEHHVDVDVLATGRFHGVPARDIVAMVLPDGGDVDAAYARIVELEVLDADGCRPLPGAVEALTAVAARGAIVTSCSRPLAEARLAAASLPVPAVVVTADDVTRGKPDPEPFTRAAAALGADPARCLVVEDAPAGLAAASAAGCARLAVSTTHPAEELEADLVVAHLAEVALTPGSGIHVRRVQ